LPARPSNAGARWQRGLTSRREIATRPLAVAITGGVGAGKSEALKAFARHGAATISSDEVVHQLYEDGEVKAALRERYGEGVFDGDEVIRAAVGAIVFADRDELAWLEQLLHPKVMARTDVWREELARLPQPPALTVNEVPLLYEAGAEDRFDAVVVITAPVEVRAERAGDRLDDRERRLLSDDVKAARADFAYVNDGSLEDLDEFVRGVVASLSTR
jgi:dephospho-CoA kinase